MGLLHAHFVRRDGQHERGFDVAAVHPKALFVGVKRLQRLAQGQLVPAAAEHREAAVAAQFTRHHIHQSHIAAVRIEEQEFFDAGASHRLAQAAPLLDDRSR